MELWVSGYENPILCAEASVGSHPDKPPNSRMTFGSSDQNKMSQRQGDAVEKPGYG